jgi:aspartate 1-decarboxylase
MSFCHLSTEELAVHSPKVVLVGPGNTVGRVIRYDP